MVLTEILATRCFLRLMSRPLRADLQLLGMIGWRSSLEVLDHSAVIRLCMHVLLAAATCQTCKLRLSKCLQHFAAAAARCQRAKLAVQTLTDSAHPMICEMTSFGPY